MRSRGVVLLGLLLFAIPSQTAQADDDTGAHAGTGQFGVWVTDDDGGETPTNDVSTPLGTYYQEPACDGVCSGIRTCPDGTIQVHSWIELPNGERAGESYWCPSEGGPALTGGLIATAFRRIPLPPSSFSIQPPGGQTLVNFETNFFTEERTLDRTVRLLGQRVDLRIWAHSYTWHFGDGEAITTSKPGAPYPKLLITHNYLEKGAYRPKMDTTWVADYRVGAGAWQSVPGSVTIEGSPTNLQAIEARPTLVGYGG
jgi:hypothetical protein